MTERADGDRRRPDRDTNGCDAVFVYGTLLRGEERSHVVRSLGARVTLLAECVGRLFDLGPYPGMVEVCGTEEAPLVQGELVRFYDIRQALATLDTIEGFVAPGSPQNLFERCRVLVGMCDGRVREAWTWLYRGDTSGARVIESHDWRAYRGRREAFLEALVDGHLRGQELPSIASRLQRPWYRPDIQVESAAELVRSLRDGGLSERQLAQATGRWSVSARPAPGERQGQRA